jgi:hypothetical protein
VGPAAAHTPSKAVARPSAPPPPPFSFVSLFCSFCGLALLLVCTPVVSAMYSESPGWEVSKTLVNFSYVLDTAVDQVHTVLEDFARAKMRQIALHCRIYILAYGVYIHPLPEKYISKYINNYEKTIWCTHLEILCTCKVLQEKKCCVHTAKKNFWCSKISIYVIFLSSYISHKSCLLTTKSFRG